MYEVLFYNSKGQSLHVLLDGLPTDDDIPDWCVRVDIAIPYN